MDKSSNYSYAWPCAVIGVIGVAAVLFFFYYETEDQRRLREESMENREILLERLRKAEDAKKWMEQQRTGMKLD